MLQKRRPERNGRLPNQQALADLPFLHHRPSQPSHLEVRLNQQLLARQEDGVWLADTLVGTDSHTTMINGLGVLGWGVGGIEAEAVMLGQPIYMLAPDVIGVRLTGQLKPGVTATDMTLRIVEMLREHGVVGKFVEFFGSGMAALTLADRATIANMAPEYGATCGFFPVDDRTLDYMRLTGREDADIAGVEEYCKAQGLWYDVSSPEKSYTALLELDLDTIPLPKNSTNFPTTPCSLSISTILKVISVAITPDMFRQRYADAMSEPRWDSIPAESSPLYPWEDDSTYIRLPTFFSGLSPEPSPIAPIEDA